MHIGIDCRMWGRGFGIGRYVSELVVHLLTLPTNHTYTLFFDADFSKSAYETLVVPPHVQKVLVAAPHYSMREQTIFVRELYRAKCDLVHFPHFNVPLLYRKPYVVTIHDMTHHKFPGRKKSHIIHRLAYRTIFAHAVKCASHIIAVSKSAHDELRAYFASLPPCTVVAEGVGKRYVPQSTDAIRHVGKKYGIVNPYILFVGEWRRYKNIPFLVTSFEQLRTRHKELTLVLAGRPDPWYPEVQHAVVASAAKDAILTPGFVAEDDLPALYSGASLFVLPTLYEGFGLIALEALACGTPALTSNIPVLKEIKAREMHCTAIDSAVSFAQTLEKLLRDMHSKPRARDDAPRVQEHYSWMKTAEATHNIYNSLSHAKKNSHTHIC